MSKLHRFAFEMMHVFIMGDTKIHLLFAARSPTQG